MPDNEPIMHKNTPHPVAHLQLKIEVTC